MLGPRQHRRGQPRPQHQLQRGHGDHPDGQELRREPRPRRARDDPDLHRDKTEGRTGADAPTGVPAPRAEHIASQVGSSSARSSRAGTPSAFTRPARHRARDEHGLLRDGRGDGGVLRGDVRVISARARTAARRAGRHGPGAGCPGGLLGARPARGGRGTDSYALAVAADASRTPLLFDPSAFKTFVFLDRELDEDGLVTLRYALDEELFFEERFAAPRPAPARRRRAIPRGGAARAAALGRRGQLLQAGRATAGASSRASRPRAATAALLEALYSEGLGEFAYTNRLARPAPTALLGRAGDERADVAGVPPRRSTAQPERVLVPVGGGKDSAVAIEIVRRSGLPSALFSIGDAPPIARTVAAAGLPWLTGAAGARPAVGPAERGRGAQRPRAGDRDRDRGGAAVRVR